jgi:type IV pilus assembly protein PilE
MKQAGFTLIEVLIVVAIIAILAAIAYPSYQAQIRDARRAEGRAALVQNAQALERLYTETGCYNPGDDMDCSVGTAGLPSSFLIETDYYTITADTLSAAAFELEAAPKDSQVGDECGDLTYDHVGQKGATGTGDCW